MEKCMCGDQACTGRFLFVHVAKFSYIYADVGRILGVSFFCSSCRFSSRRSNRYRMHIRPCSRNILSKNIQGDNFRFFWNICIFAA